MRKTRILVSLMAVVALALASVAALASEAQEITFGMSMEEVEAIAGRRDWQDQVASPTAGIYDQLNYRNQKISKFEDAQLRYVFADNKLIARIYEFEESRAGKYGYLAGALESKYGAGGKNYNSVSRILDYYIGTGTLDDATAEAFVEFGEGQISSWTTDDGTEIILMYLKYQGQELTWLGYLAPADSLSVEYDDSGL